MPIHTFFAESSYHTREDTPRSIWDKLALNSRWYYIGHWVYYVLRGRKIAIKGLYDREAWASTSFDVLKLIESCGGRFHITGLDNLRKVSPPVVFISNHMSQLESMVFPCIIAPEMEVTFVVKEGLVKHPVFGPVMRARKPIVVSRENSREDFKKVMDQGLELLTKGISVVIFPQSSRKVEFIPEEFNTLGVKLACRANVKVIPIAIKTDFWKNGKYLRDLGPIDRRKSIHMHFEEPMTICGSGKEENQQIVDFIVAHLEEWKD
jgi:1-acyl-sn-glycerol-3-phosphate acyltransferase